MASKCLQLEMEIRVQNANRLTTIYQSTLPRGPELFKYESLLARANTLDVSREVLTTMSTADDLARWLQCSPSPISALGMCSVQEILLNIIKQDSWEVLRLIELTLAEIGHEILDDSILQGRLQHWRSIIEKIERELHYLYENLTEFAGSLPNSTLDLQQAVDISISLLISVSLSDLEARIAKIQKLTVKTYKSLMANVAIMKGKRAIASSENIAKITELSFVFIPLAFSASVFSVQVRELRDAQVSFLTFFLSASSLVLTLYGLRLMIRSSWMTALLKSCRSQVKANAKLQHGAPIPTRSFVFWMGRNAGLMLLYVGVMISPMVPGLVLLWKRVHNVHLDAFVTAVVLSDILVIARSLRSILFYSDNRGIHLRYSLFPLHKIQSHPGKILILPPWDSGRRPEQRIHSEAYAV